MSLSESKLEAKTRQLAILHDFLEKIARDRMLDVDGRAIRTFAQEALKAWDKPDEPDGT